jgi:cytochrome c6
LVAIALALLAFIAPASADDNLMGAKVFSANCAACHMGGRNVVAANKNLKAETLAKYGMDSEAAIIQQVTNGKAAMPAFKARLKPEQIQAVAAYVLDQASHDWRS